ncbi:MAG: acetate--CoA ligase family protein [Holosporales bacterium]|jgi:acetyltransferase
MPASLASFFAPSRIALLGASTKPTKVGHVVAQNLLAPGMKIPVDFINPKGGQLGNVPILTNLEAVSAPPELVILSVPPQEALAAIPSIAASGAKAILCLTAGIDREAVKKLCVQYNLRFMGPNCLGLMVPHLGLNASFGGDMPMPGHVALVAQSGAIVTALAAWGKTHSIGFSHLVSLGDMADVTITDMLAYLAFVDECQAIALYVEGIKNGAQFVATARAVAGQKPVIALKSGRFQASAAAAQSHTGALAGIDQVYSAAFHKTGIRRCLNFGSFRDEIRGISRYGITATGRQHLLIVTNGGGFGVLAADALIAHGGTLAILPQDIKNALNSVLPKTWSLSNPIDIIGDADPERYAVVLRILRSIDWGTAGIDAILVLNAPTGISDSVAVARTVALEARGFGVPVYGCWMGGGAAESAARLLEESGIPCYGSPEAAVASALAPKAAQTNGHCLTSPFDLGAIEAIRAILAGGKAAKRTWLHEVEAKNIFRHAGIGTVPTLLAKTPEEAESLAARWPGEKLAVKIVADGLLHKSDIGGVALNVPHPKAVYDAAKAMYQRLVLNQSHPTFIGFAVQPMASRPKAYEIIIGLNRDATFGTVVLFGQGGTSVEAVKDQALTLTPITTGEAGYLIRKTRVYRMLKGYRNRPAVDFTALEDALVRLSWLGELFNDIQELDINPLLLDETGILAVDGRIRIS